MVSLSVLALGLCAITPARADRVACPPPQGLRVQSVRALEVRAPTEDRDVAIARVSEGMSGFHARIERCLQDRGEQLGGGRLRARVRYERSELPTRARVVENGLGAAAGACISEVIPSLLVRPAPRGDLTIEITIASGWQHSPW